ncbi:MAG: hypothetical protein AAF658_09435, partial [Myxococcota bacterium]
MKHLAALIVLLTPSAVLAQNVSIDFAPGADAQTAADFVGASLGDFEAQLETQVADALALLDTEGYLQPFADAGAFSTKGIMVDYASDFDILLIGVGVSSSFAVTGDIAPDGVDRAVDGFAPNASIFVGLDLGALRLFASGFRRGGSFGDQDEFDLQLDNLGFHAQLKLFGGSGDTGSELVFDWRGFDITAGVTRSTTTLSLEQDLPTEFSLGEGSEQLPIDLV